MNCHCYVIALYCRLSSLNTDKANSIENQKILLKNYLNSFLKKEHIPDYKVEEYEDNGYSGMDFKRPDVKKLMEKIQEKKINCIIVKDFSRFGRDNIMMDKFLNEIFPYNDIRFISILDQYDNAKISGETSLEVDFKLLMNSFYSKDISQKIQSAYKTKMEHGNYIPSFGFYGYLKDNKNKSYIIDQEPYQVIRYMVQMALEHRPVKEIAKSLNKLKIPTPGQYKQMKMGYSKMYKMENAFWNTAMIYRILRDRSYTGVKYVGKSRAIKRKRKVVPASEWYLNTTMDPIISEEEFEKINCFIQPTKRKTSEFKTNPGEKNLFKGKIICGGCKHKMQMYSHKGKLLYYYCSGAICNVPDICYNGRFPKQKLYDYIYDAIQKQIQLIDTACGFASKQIQFHVDFETQVQNSNLRKRQIQTEKFDMFEKLSKGEVTEDDYKKGIDVFNSELSAIEDSLTYSKKLLADREESLQKISEMVRLTSYAGQALNNEMVQSFVKNVIIYSDDRIEIEWNFHDLTKCI